MAWVKRNVFPSGLRIVFQNLFVCEVVRAGTWLEVDQMVSSPWELPMASTSVKNRDPLVWGQ